MFLKYKKLPNTKWQFFPYSTIEISTTVLYDKDMSGKIIKKNNNIAIDCDCIFGCALGCICLNTLEEFYIDRNGKIY